MKQKIQKRIEQKLALLASQVLERHQPKIVAVTGSVGKTSAKDAIATVLGSKYSVRASSGNYNNELGLPLTILGEESPGRSVFGWWRLMSRARRVASGGDDYPQVLVLEMGADRPGDIANLTKIAPPDVAVVTQVSESHLEFFDSVDAIANEKSQVVRALKSDGVAVLNVDNDLSARMRQHSSGTTMTFGTSQADVQAGEANVLTDISESNIPNTNVDALKHAGLPLGTKIEVTHGGKSAQVVLPGALGKQHVYAVLAGIAVGIALDVSLDQAAGTLMSYVPPRGRMNMISGLKDSLLIDDTYNASIASTIAALETLGSMPVKGRRIAILGDMAELGAATETGHRDVGKHAAHTCDFAIFVGPKMKFAAAAAEEAGLVDEKQTHVNDSRQVENVIQPMINAGDVLLIKGSQSVRMERAVKALMSDPLRAEALLVRQGPEW